MDYEQFKEGFREDLKAALQARGIAADLRENHVEKLNQSYDALSVTPEGSNIGVNLNLGSIFEAHDAGLSYKEALDRAVSQVEAGIEQIPALHAADIVNYDEMKSKLSMEVVSVERNADLLQKIPHEQMEDMAVVYRLILGETPGGHNTLLVTNDLMEQFGITKEQLHADAMVNAPEIRPSEIRGMTEVMNEDGETAAWESTVTLVRATKDQVEADLEGRGSSFRVVIGSYQYGHFICIPTIDVGCPLAGWNDVFYRIGTQ